MPASWDDCRSRRTWGTRTVLGGGAAPLSRLQMGNTLVCFSVEGTLEGFQSVGLEVQVLHHDFGVRILQLSLLVLPHQSLCGPCSVEETWFSGYWSAGWSPSGRS